MLDAIRGLAAFAIAGLATTVSLGHIHAPAHPHTTPAKVHAAAPGLDVIAGQYIPGVMALAFEPVGPPSVADNPPPPEAPVYSGGGGTPAYTRPSGGGGSAPAPAVSIGSAQQSYINSDRAAAGLPPLT